MEKNKPYLNQVALISVIIATLSIAYYFLYSMPSYNNQKLNLQREKQEEEMKYERDKTARERENQQKENNIKMLELTKIVQDDCIEIVQGTISYFDKTNTTVSPLFYPYENENSFNRNERLLTALGTYISCIYNDPRYNKENEAMGSILTDAGVAETEINNFMFEYKEKTPNLCESALLTEAAKKTCESLTKKEYDFGV